MISVRISDSIWVLFLSHLVNFFSDFFRRRSALHTTQAADSSYSHVSVRSVLNSPPTIMLFLSRIVEGLPAFTLNVGLRLRVTSRSPAPSINLVIRTIPQTSQLPTDKNNFGPRIGLRPGMSLATAKPLSYLARHVIRSIINSRRVQRSDHHGCGYWSAYIPLLISAAPLVRLFGFFFLSDNSRGAPGAGGQDQTRSSSIPISKSSLHEGGSTVERGSWLGHRAPSSLPWQLRP